MCQDNQKHIIVSCILWLVAVYILMFICSSMLAQVPSWCNVPVASASSKSSWLTPAVTNDAEPVTSEKSWLNPPVSSTKRKASSGCDDVQQTHAPKWMRPNPGSSIERPKIEHPKYKTPEIDITVGMALLACGETALDLDMGKLKVSKLPKEVLQPCKHGKGKLGCSTCEKLDAGWLNDFNTFLAVWGTMTANMKSVLMSTAYADSNAHTRVHWSLCGKRICVSRMCELLRTSPRSHYKKVHGVPDRRQNNRRNPTNSSMSVDAFFLDLYHSTAEFLPEICNYHLSNVDEAMDNVEDVETPNQVDYLPLIGNDPEKSVVQNIRTASGDFSSLPIRFVQHQRVIDLFWLYLAWIGSRSSDKPASWTTFWRRWCSCSSL